MAKDQTVIAEKWARRMKNATGDMRDGVMAVTEAPGIKAAAKQDKMKQNLMAAIDDGRWADGVKSVTLEEWKDKMINLGVNRVSAGVDSAVPKMGSFMGQFMPHIEAGQRKIATMPDLTKEDAKARMIAMFDHVSTFKYRKRR